MSGHAQVILRPGSYTNNRPGLVLDHNPPTRIVCPESWLPCTFLLYNVQRFHLWEKGTFCLHVQRFHLGEKDAFSLRGAGLYWDQAVILTTGRIVCPECWPPICLALFFWPMFSASTFLSPWIRPGIVLDHNPPTGIVCPESWLPCTFLLYNVQRLEERRFLSPCSALSPWRERRFWLRGAGSYIETRQLY